MHSIKTSPENPSRQNSILPFLFLTFSITWVLIFVTLRIQSADLAANLLGYRLRLAAVSILSFVANLGPAVAAFFVLSRKRRANERKGLIREIFALRISGRSYLLALGIPCLVLALAVIALLAITGIKFTLYDGAFGMWLDLLLFGGLLRALGEEIGWRGFLLPRLQERASGLEASMLVGLAWWTWHLPIRLEPGQSPSLVGHLIYLVDILSLSVILTWLRNVTRGSLVPVTMLHATFNAGLEMLQVPDDRWILVRWNLCLAATLLMAAGLFLTIYGKELAAVRELRASA